MFVADAETEAVAAVGIDVDAEAVIAVGVELEGEVAAVQIQAACYGTEGNVAAVTAVAEDDPLDADEAVEDEA